MNYYNYEELINKTYNEIFEIFEEEKLQVNRSKVFDYTLSKKEMINIILKYRSFKESTLKKIDILKLQEYIDLNINIVKDFSYINIPSKIIIYENIDILKEDEYIVTIDEDKFYEYVLLCNQNNYIYAVFNLLLKEKNKYYTYNLILDSKLNRLEISDQDIYYLVFLPKEFDYNRNIKFNATRVSVDKVILEKPIKNLLKQYLYFSEDKIFLNNLYLEDSYMIFKNFNILNFKEAKELKQNTNFKYSKNNINSYYNLLVDKNKYINLEDIYSNYKKVEKEDIKKDFEKNILKIVNNKNKKISEDINLVSELSNIYNYNNVYKYNSLFFINYYYISSDFTINYSHDYLIFMSENSCFSISENNYSIIDKRNRYNITLNTNIIQISTNYTYKNIINKISMYLKLNTVKNLKHIDKTYISINDLKNKNIEFQLDIDERIIDNQIKFNEESYIYYAKKIYDKLILNSNIDLSLNVNLENIRKMIYEIATEDLGRYFNKVSLIEILKKYKKIKLVGNLLNNELFLSAIKEYIPGKLIEKIKPDNKIFETVLNRYEEDIIYGKVSIEYNVKNNQYNYELSYKNYKSQYEVFLDTDERQYNFIDVYSKIKTLDLNILNKDNKKVKEKSLLFDFEYKEQDELEILNYLLEKYSIKYTQSELLDDIKEDILRIIVCIKNDQINYIYLKRINNQTYIYEFSESIEESS